jgi:predicted O-methyltransferase YrrM
MKTQEIIDQARQGFDPVLHSDEYRRIHADDEHLNALMTMLENQPGGKYMDLGTGNGYLAFEMARRFPEFRICPHISANVSGN